MVLGPAAQIVAQPLLDRALFLFRPQAHPLRRSLLLLADLAVNGYVLIRQGAAVVGVVSRAQEAKSLGRRGHVAVALKYVESVTGEHVPVSGNRYESGKGKKASELKYHFLMAKDLGLLRDSDYSRVNDGVIELKRMLASLVRKVTYERMAS